jgi:2-aminoethylphosphonate-pyruvate transaminase
MTKPQLSLSKDKILFTPGPLTTSSTVKQAMLRDLGSRDSEFIAVVAEIRDTLVRLATAAVNDYECILMQGSGTFGIEAVLSSVVPAEGRLLIVINGAYGHRMSKIADYHRIDKVELLCNENALPDPKEIEALLERDSSITDVAVVHCETTTGIMNPVRDIGDIVACMGRRYIVDAMSSFGAAPMDVAECSIDFLISSSNKCIEGVPGFSFIIARGSSLEGAQGRARSLSLDLYEQWKGFERDGQFRFTPPTHSLLAFRQALHELHAEGGIAGRAARYRRNHDLLVAGMRKLGFREYLDVAVQGHIITSFLFPEHPDFSFETFYRLLGERNQVIYPGKLSQVDCFRIGNIGRVFERDIEILLLSIQATLEEMHVSL